MALSDKTKNICAIIAIATISLLGIVGAFVPSARDYVSKIIGYISPLLPTLF